MEFEGLTAHPPLVGLMRSSSQIIPSLFQAVQVQSILFWLLFSLSPYYTTSALAGVLASYNGMQWRRDDGSSISDQQNSSNGGATDDSNTGNQLDSPESHEHTGHQHTGLRRQGIAGIVIASLPALLLLILAVRWLKTRHRHMRSDPAAVDPSSRTELAPKPRDTASSITNRRSPSLPPDADSSDAESIKLPPSQPQTQSLSYGSTFLPVLPHPFDSDANKSLHSFTTSLKTTRRASAGDTFPNSAYFTSPAISMPTSPTTPFPHSRRASYINTSNSPSPSPSQWLSRSPGGYRPRLSLQEYQLRAETGITADLSVTKKTHAQLPPVKHSIELP